MKNKTAIVTGGSRGIGRAIVLMLAREGVDVAFNYLKSGETALQFEKEVGALGVRCKASRVDIRDPEAIKAWIDGVKQEFGGIDILINNAGIIADKPLMLMTRDDWDSVINTNLNGMYHVTRACIVTFLKQKSGKIVNISSVSGLTGIPGQTNYSATKGGINAFTKALAKEVAAYGVRVNAVAPGFIETDILSGINENQMKAVLGTIPLGRLGRVEEVAGCVKFLLGEGAEYITGQVITVDGGLVMR